MIHNINKQKKITPISTNAISKRMNKHMVFYPYNLIFVRNKMNKLLIHT